MIRKKSNKFGGKHSTFIRLSGQIADFASRQAEVSKVSAGIIKQRSSKSGLSRVKIIDETGCLLLVVADGGTVQEMRIFSNESKATKEALTIFINKKKASLHFGSRLT